MHKRSAYNLLAATLIIGALAGCSSQPPAPKAGETSPAAVQTAAVPTSKAAEASPLAQMTAPAAPAASPSATLAASPAATAGRGEPKGKAGYAWHSSLSPAWNDPQEYAAGTFTPFIFAYWLHDALVKPMPGNPYAPSLAESYEIAPDFKSATFILRNGIKFHNGEPVTPEDVQFTFENYRGGNAKLLKDKVDRIEILDARTVRFVFKEPFLDFLLIYGTPVSSAGWIVPKKYYQEVGPDGFKQQPIGAGPYKLVRQIAGSELELEAFTDYWRKVPHIKTYIVKGIAEDSTRVAAFQTGEVDFVSSIPGSLWDTLLKDPRFTPAPTQGAAVFLEFSGFTEPDSPFHDQRVRQAASLAIDRQALNDAETAGLADLPGNWMPENLPGALTFPTPEHDPAKAKQLLAEAGYPNGFEVEALTPFPPFFSVGERVVTNLREIGIRTRINQMERAAYTAKLTEGPGAFKGHLLIHYSASPGDAASWIRAWATCQGSSSRTCLPEIEENFQRYEASVDPQERERLINELQRYLVDNAIFVSIFRNALLNMQGPRIANEWDEIWGAVPGHPLFAPVEDVRLTE